MAQLTDDCFAAGGPLMPIEEAVRLLEERLAPVDGVERVGIEHADGRVIARPVIAPIPLPPFTNSAVDGHAVRGDALPEGAPRVFRLVGRVAAGDDPVPVRGMDEAVRIFTGAAMPEGLDTVFMQEDVEEIDAGHVRLPPGLAPGANVRLQGEDVELGQTVLPAGHVMRPQDVAMAAALDRTDLMVRRRIRVAILSTGDEIVPPGATRGLAQLFDANRFMLMALVRRLGGEVEDLGILNDDEARTAETLARAAARNDLVLSTGGVSMGDADFVRRAVESIGRLVFWRLAIKPGRPVAMGVIRGTAFIGLPGNPVAAFVTFAHVARTALLRLAGAPTALPPPMMVKADFEQAKKPGRREYVRARLRISNGEPVAERFSRQGAGMLSSLVETDGLISLAPDIRRVSRGDLVPFRSYAGFLDGAAATGAPGTSPLISDEVRG